MKATFCQNYKTKLSWTCIPSYQAFAEEDLVLLINMYICYLPLESVSKCKLSLSPFELLYTITSAELRNYEKKNSENNKYFLMFL